MARSTGRTRPVIKDVAKLAGVSAPTVSRYLNGTVNVTEDRRARIAKAIKELGYEPSIVARALSNREMDSVVVFAANPAAFSTSETNHGVEAAARKRRFLLNIVSLDESDMESVEARVRMGLSIRPAGVVVYEYDQAGIAALDYIPKDMPKVVVGGSFGDGDYQIINAERDGGRWMTMHLLDLGHKTVFYVGRVQGATDNTRANGWKDALEERGIEAPEPIVVSDGNLEKVPDDVSVVGFDDRNFGALWEPSLTSYTQNFLDMGERSFRMLFEQIQAKRMGADMPPSQIEVVQGQPCLRASEREI